MGGFLSSLFGSKPNVPGLRQLDLGTEQALSIANNQRNLPGMEALIGQANAFTAEDINKWLSIAMPWYQSASTQIGKNINDELAGKIPTDVSQQVQNSAAAKAIGGGFSGSGMHGDLVARDLGLTSLDLTQKGLSSAESWMQTMDKLYAPSMISLKDMFISPTQQASFDVSERNMAWSRDWLQNQINAMPDPTTVGLWNATWSVIDAALSAYTGQSVDLGRIDPKGSYAGMGAGGMGGGGGFGGGGMGGGDAGVAAGEIGVG
jgi:hypothetical protein